MRIVGFEDDHIDGRLTQLFELYLSYLDEELRVGAQGIRVMPGVHDLLDALDARDDVIVGLLTGNIAPGARAKLMSAGIDPARFAIGAYGSDHERRGELPGVAQRRARELLGVDVAGGDVIVIGDTPADIDCGRAIGARAIAVATGSFSMDELRLHGPAALFRDLSATADVIRAIMADEPATWPS
jgi:phosphoglycolate phosphatase-like HAD superfamily hydrolase